jgi:predicted RNase H-like HicB family nuclease
MSQEINVVVERDEEGWLVASVPELPGCYTQARSMDELIERISEAALLYLESTGQPVPRMQFVGVQRVALSA